MKQNYQFFIGFDVSKKTLDYCVLEGTQCVTYGNIPNSAKGLKMLEKTLKSRRVPLDKTRVCWENTGLYTQPLLDWSTIQHVNMWLAHPLRIKRSQGLVRGKSDQIDAKQIARYACRHQDISQLWEAPRPILNELKSFVAARVKNIKITQQIKHSLQEIEAMEGAEAYRRMYACYEKTLQALKEDLQQIEQNIKACIKADEELKEKYNIITSVPGAGRVLAINMLVTTNEFKITTDERKVACYAGVVPFERTSGTSIQGRKKVSMYANKSLKKLLHMGALSIAYRQNNALATYYKRKITEGKPVMSVLNAIRNKMIMRICACVRNHRKYQKNYMKKVA